MNYSFLIPTLLILVVIMGYYFFRPRLPIRLNRAFLAILVISIFTEIFEAVSARLNETWTEHPPWLLCTFGVLFLFFYISRAYMFFVFSISVLDADNIPRSKLHRYTPVVFFAFTIITVISPFTGFMFYVDNGFHTGPMYYLLYACSAAYAWFALLAVHLHRKALTPHKIISIVAIQVILLVGNYVRFLFPNWLVMNTFSLMAIIVVFLSFLNPDLYMSDHGYAYNLPAFKALVAECVRRRRPCRILGFVLQNYNEHREIFGGAQMDEALTSINKYLADAFPQMSSFYLRNGFFALVGQNLPDLEDIREKLRMRFSFPWKSGSNGELRMTVSFVEADTEILATRTLPYTMTGTENFSAIHSNPPGVHTGEPCATLRKMGESRLLWVAAPIETARPYMSRQAVRNLIGLLLPEQRWTSNAPKFAEILSWDKDGETYFAAIIEQEESPVVPLDEIWIEVPGDRKAVLLPEGQALRCEKKDGKTRIYLPKLHLFQVLKLC